MHDNPKSPIEWKLHYFLASLDPDELAAFGQYLDSPLFGKSPKLREFLDLYIVTVLHAPSPPSEADFWRQLYPEKELDGRNQNYFRLVKTTLLAKLMDFFSWQGYMDDPHAAKLYRMEAFAAKGWDRHFDSEYRRICKSLPPQGAERYFHRLMLEKKVNAVKAENMTRSTVTHLERVLDSLDQIFVLEKLKYACAARNEELLFGRCLEIRFLEPVLAHCEVLAGQLPEVTLGYWHAFRLLDALCQKQDADAESRYLLLKDLLVRYQDLAYEEAEDLHKFALNYPSIQINLGNQPQRFMAECLLLYQQLLVLETIRGRGRISPKFLKNITFVMCRYGHLEWVESMLDQFKGKVLDDRRGAAWYYNRAVLLFHQGKFREAGQILHRTAHPGNFSDVYYAVAARIYQIKCQVEQVEQVQDYEDVLHLLKNYQSYLGRVLKRNNPEGDVYRNFGMHLSTYARACMGNPSRVRAKLEHLKKAMENLPQGVVSPWILQKIGTWLK